MEFEHVCGDVECEVLSILRNQIESTTERIMILTSFVFDLRLCDLCSILHNHGNQNESRANERIMILTNLFSIFVSVTHLAFSSQSQLLQVFVQTGMLY